MSFQPSRWVQPDRMEELFKALGSHWRIEILKIIAQKPCSLCDLSQILPIEKSTICRHIKVLKINHIINTTSEGAIKLISIEDQKILELLILAEQIVRQMKLFNVNNHGKERLNEI